MTRSSKGDARRKVQNRGTLYPQPFTYRWSGGAANGDRGLVATWATGQPTLFFIVATVSVDVFVANGFIDLTGPHPGPPFPSPPVAAGVFDGSTNNAPLNPTYHELPIIMSAQGRSYRKPGFGDSYDRFRGIGNFSSVGKWPTIRVSLQFPAGLGGIHADVLVVGQIVL